MINKNKGITLLALIITIIVMMILAGVSMSMLFGEDGVIKQAQESSKEYKRQAELERVITEIQFTPNTAGKRMKPETVTDLAIKIVDKELNKNELIVLYNPSNDTENIMYKYNESMTKEEKDSFAQLDIYLLKGDLDGNGIIDENDLNKLKLYFMDPTSVEINKELADINRSGRIDLIDENILSELINGTIEEYDYQKYFINQKVDIHFILRSIRNDIYQKYKKINYDDWAVKFKKDDDNRDNDIGYTYYKDIILKYENKFNGVKFIVYRYDLLDENEKNIINEYGDYSYYDENISKMYFNYLKMLKGDADLNGKFEQADIDYINNYLNNGLAEEEKDKFEEKLETRTIIVDMNNNNTIDEADLEKLTKVLNGKASMYDDWK